jgi:hypothetical protein
MNRGAFISILLVITVIVGLQLPHALGDSCGVVNIRYHPPETSHPGEPIQMVSVVTASCYYYSTVIVNLVDSRSSRVLSTVSWPYDPLGNPVSPPLVNHAMTPNQLGYWALSLQTNFAGSSTNIQFTILVEPGA